MIRSSSCPPWQPDNTGHARRRSRRPRRCYTTPRDTIADLRTLAATIKARWTCEQAHQQLKEGTLSRSFRGPILAEPASRRIFDLAPGGISDKNSLTTGRAFFKRELPAREQRTVLGNNCCMRSRRLRFLDVSVAKMPASVE
jgi:hypothetical protein